MTATVLKLIARRLIAAVPILLIVSALLFLFLRLLPVDPAAMSLPPNATIAEIEDKRREMGLDKPLPQQYLICLARALPRACCCSLWGARSWSRWRTWPRSCCCRFRNFSGA